MAKSTVTLKQIDDFLQELTTVRSEEAQYNVFCKILPKITAGIFSLLDLSFPFLTRWTDDLKILMKIIDHDLKINIGPKYVLGALHPDGIPSFSSHPFLPAYLVRPVKGKLTLLYSFHGI